MLDFIFELERVITKWPEHSPWTVAQVADYCNVPVSVAVDAVSTSLNREFDPQETMSVAEGRQVLGNLKERMHRQLQARERKIEAEREAAMRAYDLTMDKIRVIQVSKDWRTAYKTLSYFVGRFEKHIPQNLLVSLCGDCIRLGSKADVNVQELGLWLRKAVESAVLSGSTEALEDALDFVDAFGEIFSNDKNGIGGKLISTALTVLKVPSLDCNLIDQWSALHSQLMSPTANA